jgi:hypothetical protein
MINIDWLNANAWWWVPCVIVIYFYWKWKSDWKLLKLEARLKRVENQLEQCRSDCSWQATRLNGLETRLKEKLGDDLILDKWQRPIAPSIPEEFRND